MTLLPMMHKIHSKILSVDWHPDDENLLAYSTIEGRVGIFNTAAANVNNSNNILKNFTGKPVYSISFGKINIDNKSTPVLFACGDGRLVYFIEGKDGKYRKYNEYL